MKTLDEYIDDKNIVFYLCRIRAKIAKSRNKDHLIHLISSDSFYNYHKKPISANEKEICSLFPSRKKWKKLGEKNRYKKGKKLNSLEKNVRSLQITIKWYRVNEPEAEFLKRLDSFVLSIQESIADSNYCISKPETYPKKKDKVEREQTICRPISIFNLRDRIIICLVNKYFTDLFDGFFFKNSMAFRAVKKVDGTSKSITHHDAIKAILEYKDENKEKNLWVSECDMKKFYDTVNHSVIKLFFKRFIKQIKTTNSELYNQDAERIFYSYLNCYSFNKSVYPLNRDQEYFSKFNIKNGVFEWVEKDLLEYHYKKLNNAKIGVPQGGALSGLIANIVLHYSDTIISKRQDTNILYLRYCDDMIIMHPSKKICEEATNDYKTSLLKLKLVPHDFKAVDTYDKAFWSNKSKKPYKWGDHDKLEIPWIGFVGYEINFNGDIRIRRSSIKKEMSKQFEVIDLAWNAIKGDKKRAADKYIEESIIHRLIGMSVGRVSMWNYTNGINDLCWINGFSELYPNPTVAIQLKKLDRNRNKYFKQFKRKLKETKMNESDQVNAKSNRQIIYIGKPFSYYYQAYEKPKQLDSKAKLTS
ncbi:MAG: reverse transcriptase domain-containing protein [Paludibacter sp.]|nr:reverse transcriptase domain-containing protein [Paludibacter sp.]